MADLDMDEFLGHKTSALRDKNTYLGKWKDREAGKKRPAHAVDIWLHRNAPITVLWRHQLPRVVVFEKKDETKVWSQNLVCWEDESVLRKQYKRNDDGTRLVPPERCPLCKLIEWVRKSVEAGELSWVEPLFKYRGDDGETILRAGGLYNAYAADDLTDADKAELKKNKIYRKEAWKQNAMTKATYCFRVVDHEHPEKGVQVAIEPALLGDKVKQVISKAMEEAESEGDRTLGDPRLHPYAIRWKHLPEEQEFGKKYDATKLKLPLSEEIENLITEVAPPDIADLKKKFDAQKLRAELEEACMVEDIPWDEIFDGADKDVFDEAIEERKAKGGKAKPKPSAPPDSDAGDDDDEDSAEDKPKKKEEMVACDECEKPHAVSAKKCPHCGHEYDVEYDKPEDEPKEKERKLPKRSELKKQRAAEAASKDKGAKPDAKKGKDATRVASDKKKPKDSDSGGVGAFGESFDDDEGVPF